MLASTFSARQASPVYSRFISVLRDIQPCFVVTTNVDRSLEASLPEFELIERSDLERAIHFIQKETPFICKMHGSISQIESIIFTEEDYQGLTTDKRYLELLLQVFSISSVVFLGYSLSDAYIHELLNKSVGLKRLFGDGPHFLVTTKKEIELPDSVHVIRYNADPHVDHRSAIQVVDVIRYASMTQVSSNEDQEPQIDQKKQLESAYFISDLYPPGTWNSSQTFTAKRENNPDIQVTVGTGFVDDEIPFKVSTALHDLLVGLICFNRVYFPLSSLSKVHELIGSDRFWRIVDEDVFRFVHFEGEPGIIFPSIDASTGDIGTIVAGGRVIFSPVSVPEVIRKHLIPAPGHESVAEARLDSLAEKVHVFKEGPDSRVPELTRGTLLHPQIRKLIGLSESILPSRIPKWYMFPVLRLSHVLLAGMICERLRIAAVKIHYGGEMLAGVAFAAAASRDWAEDVASYVAAGKFGADLGTLVAASPEILDAILRFRRTQAGEKLRTEILAELSTNKAGEVVSAIDAGLKQSIPAKVLQQAQEQLSQLMLAAPRKQLVIPAVWSNARYGDKALNLWRMRSLATLEQYCRSHNIGSYDLCPCGSGEKLRFCCLRALKG
jgi:hypothetical protein